MIEIVGKTLRSAIRSTHSATLAAHGTARRLYVTLADHRASQPTAAVAILLLSAACSQPPSPVTSAPRTPAVCEALRPAMPISYSGSRDTRETVRNVREANARFEAACP